MKEIIDGILKGTRKTSPPSSKEFSELKQKLKTFLIKDVLPAEKEYFAVLEKDKWQQPKIMEQLKQKARDLGLWNLFLPEWHGFTTNQYFQLCCLLGYSILTPEATNSNAPDTGNMEVLMDFANQQQKEKYLVPLLKGETRSCFAMTEPLVSSANAVNISTSLSEKDGKFILSGRKWYITNGGHPNVDFFLVVCRSLRLKSEPKHAQHSILLVPRNSPGIQLVRPMKTFGFDDEPFGHYEIIFDQVEVSKENLIGQEGDGFKILQSRLGTGRLHHCFRAIGMGQRALDETLEHLMRFRSKPEKNSLLNHPVTVQKLGQMNCLLENMRSICQTNSLAIDDLNLEKHQKDKLKLKKYRELVSITKASVPLSIGQLIDMGIQLMGARGLSQDTPLAQLAVGMRSLRLADGPDEVHWELVGKLLTQSYQKSNL